MCKRPARDVYAANRSGYASVTRTDNVEIITRIRNFFGPLKYGFSGCRGFEKNAGKHAGRRRLGSLTMDQT